MIVVEGKELDDGVDEDEYTDGYEDYDGDPDGDLDDDDSTTGIYGLDDYEDLILDDLRARVWSGGFTYTIGQRSRMLFWLAVRAVAAGPAGLFGNLQRWAVERCSKIAYPPVKSSRPAGMASDDPEIPF